MSKVQYTAEEIQTISRLRDEGKTARQIGEAIDVAIAILSGINKQEKPDKKEKTKKPEKTYYYGG